MKYSVIFSFIASAAVFAGTIENRFEMADSSKMSLSAGCKNIDLISNHILKATCHGPAVTHHVDKNGNVQPNLSWRDVELDLNLCFANYRGTLNRDYNKGGFSSSCEACVIVEGMKLRCACKTGWEEPKYKTTFAELDNWRTVHVGDDGSLDCANKDGLE